METRHRLTAERFDALLAGPERIWGLTNIASAIGVSVDKARRLSRNPDVPIYRPPGAGYFTTRRELAQWLRTK